MLIAETTCPKRLIARFPSLIHLRSNLNPDALYNRPECQPSHTLAVPARSIQESSPPFSQWSRLRSTLFAVLDSLIHSTLLPRKQH
jgi:hypothetical protein